MQTENLKFSIGTSKGLYFFNPDEIIRLEARSNYTNIYFINQKKMLTAKVLKEFEEMLEPFGFVRTHRTHLVNRHHILCITRERNIIMRDASVAEISRRMKGNVMKALKNAA
jgi:two-component system LytT family response regulator